MTMTMILVTQYFHSFIVYRTVKVAHAISYDVLDTMQNYNYIVNYIKSRHCM